MSRSTAEGTGGASFHIRVSQFQILGASPSNESVRMHLKRFSVPANTTWIALYKRLEIEGAAWPSGAAHMRMPSVYGSPG